MVSSPSSENRFEDVDNTRDVLGFSLHLLNDSLLGVRSLLFVSNECLFGETGSESSDLIFRLSSKLFTIELTFGLISSLKDMIID